MATVDPGEFVRAGDEAISIIDSSSYPLHFDELHSRLLQITSACQADHSELLSVIEDLRTAVRASENTLEEARQKDAATVPADVLKRELDSLRLRQLTLREDERRLESELDALNEQLEGLNAEKDVLRKDEKEWQRNQMVMHLCVSIFHLIPCFEGQSGAIEGNVINSKGQVIDTFEFDAKDMSEFDISNKLCNISETERDAPS